MTLEEKIKFVKELIEEEKRWNSIITGPTVSDCDNEIIQNSNNTILILEETLEMYNKLYSENG